MLGFWETFGMWGVFAFLFGVFVWALVVALMPLPETCGNQSGCAQKQQYGLPTRFLQI